MKNYLAKLLYYVIYTGLFGEFEKYILAGPLLKHLDLPYAADG